MTGDNINIYQDKDTMYAYHLARQQLNNRMDSIVAHPVAQNPPRDDGGRYNLQQAVSRVNVQVNSISDMNVPRDIVFCASCSEQHTHGCTYQVRKQRTTTYTSRIRKVRTDALNVLYQPRQCVRVVLIYSS